MVLVSTFKRPNKPERHFGRHPIGWLSLAVISILVAGCSGSADSPGPAESDGLAIVETMTMRLQEQVSVLDPAVNSGNAAAQVRILTAGQLFRFDQDGVPQPELVESSETSADGLTVTMTLKPDLAYSDDTPLVAGDVVAMYERSILSKEAGSALFTPFVDGVTAPDDQTAVWSLLRPYAGLLLALAMSEVLLHPTEAMMDEDYFQAPVSAGPYMIVDFSPGDQVLRLEENPNYVGGSLMVKNIDVITVPDVTQTALQLTSGDLDFAYGLPFSFAGTLGEQSDISVLAHPTGGVFQLGLNTRLGGPLGDPQVRQAMSLAIDRQEVAEKAFLNQTEVNPAWVFATDPFYTPALPNDGKRDVEGAMALLAETPYADGFEFTIDTFGVRDGATAAVLLIKEQLAEIGITVTANPLEVATSTERLNTGNFEGFFLGSAAPSGASVMAVDFCPSGAWGGWMPSGNPELCDLAITAMGEEDPTDTLIRAQELAIESMPIIPMVSRVDMVGTLLPLEIFGPVANTSWLTVATTESMGS